ncbi:hypothetical protein UK23_25735 [Lentzea aerocolonigenes]|uniref:Uncharacterized protein n=1 Tax=Lentzea aerocolonigenes TaxID=68170 RepID=A0A0F0GVV9_LENAE|nr:hypothetical protein [Lentzea aerocolonigenes]KJK45553.1 hypothetical protein UK23_25735 [Lentzea aerocolonigenes]
MTRRDDDLAQDSILRGAHTGAWLLGLALLALALVGVIRWPHPVWLAPISCALLALSATHRFRRGRILLGVLALALLIGTAALAELALDIVR